MAHAALLRVCLRMLVAREGAPQRTLLDREGTPPRVLVAREGRHTPRVLTEGERWRLAFAVERYAAQEPPPPPKWRTPRCRVCASSTGTWELSLRGEEG